MVKKIDIEKIEFREDLYPRFEPNVKKIQEYSENVEKLPAIVISQDNILIDGWHRVKAYKQAGEKKINVKVEEMDSEKELYLRAIELNAKHGLQLSQDEKKSIAVNEYDLKNKERLCNILSIPKRTFASWTENKRKQLKDERDREIVSAYLHAETTQKEVAKEFDITQQAIGKIIETFTNNGKIAESCKSFNPFLYNTWNTQKDNKITHFGNIPQKFIENLIYYYTEPFDTVYDPFAGGGITIDACKKWYRRYYVSDRKPIPAREEEIKKWDITNGLPKNLRGGIKLVFLDPPYWNQAKEKYSKNKKDLANMSLKKFYNTMEKFVKKIKKKLSADGVIALIMGASQWPNKNHERIDLAVDLIRMFEKNGFEIEQRIICPYSTNQYNGNQVDIAKEEKIMLNLYRDLVIFKKSK